MLSIRIKSMLNGYKRNNTSTELFLQDLSKVDKFMTLVHEKKDFFKVRNKLCEITEVFSLECVDDYIVEYYSDIFDEESMELYYLSYTDIKGIKK